MEKFIYNQLDDQKGASSAQVGDFLMGSENSIERQTPKLAIKEPEFNITGTALNSL